MAGARPASLPDLSTIVLQEPVDEALFHANPEYCLVEKSLEILETQLAQARRDIQTLQKAKEEALAEPEKFIRILADDRECARRFPRLQEVHFIPELSLQQYQRRFTRRGNNKFDQNFGRIVELQRQRPSTPTVSSSVPISGTPVSATATATATTTEESHQEMTSNMVLSIRRKFLEITGHSMRSASLPALPIHETSMMGDGAFTPPNRMDIFSPQPRKAQSIHFTVPFLPSYADAGQSRASSPLNSAPSSVAVTPNSQSADGTLRAHLSGQDGGSSLGSSSSTFASPLQMGGERKRRKMIPGNDASHHNLPWTLEEKQRLLELLEIYPEEDVQSRRYAKISSAIGTRTPGQVANRVNKLTSRRRRQADEDERIDPGDDIDEILDEESRKSKEYREYQRLKRQLEMIEMDPTLPVHHGFKCDDCGVEPIVGDRWRCTKCREPLAIDLCADCYQDATFRTKLHRPSHRFMRHSH